MKTLVIYPGRFQPFHKGHGMVYKWLKEKFGDVIITTSDKVDPPRSPFTFEEKKQMMKLAGVNAKDIKQAKNPYLAKEVLSQYDPQNTVVIFAVSEKDMAEDPRFSFKPTKSGAPSASQPYKGNEKNLKPFLNPEKPRSYVIVTPTFNFDVLGEPMKSASEFRANFAAANAATKKKMIKDLYGGNYSEKVYNLMASKIKKSRVIKEFREYNIGLTLSRSLMPQVGASASFVEYLKNNSIQATRQLIDPNSLKSSQMDFDYNKIENLRNQKSDNPIVVSNDDHVLDGHHRWLADKMENRNCTAYRVDLPILELIRVAKEFENKSNGKLDEALDHKTFGPMLDTFVKFASDHLGLEDVPGITYDSSMTNSFGGYNPGTKHITVATKNRHPMDIFRTVAHELVHHKQNGEGRIKDVAKEGATGSEIENEANSHAGIIMRNFAKEYPSAFEQSYVVEEVIQEGINDQGIFKVVFLAGGPGSGKDYVLSQTIEGNGLTEINSDQALEFLMNKEGLDLKMPESEKAERDVVRGRAKNVTKEKQRLSLAGRKGIVVNGTADDPIKIAQMKSDFESMGYDTMMVFVNTSDEVSRQRNLMRGKAGGRKVPDGTDAEGNPDGSEDIRKMKWEAAQKGKPMLKKLFGEKNFIEFDNSADLRTASKEVQDAKKKEMLNIFKQVRSFSVAPPSNPNASNWIEKELVKRGISDFTPSKAATSYGTQKTGKYNPPMKQSVMDMAAKMGLQYYGFGRFGKDNTVTHIEKDGQLILKPKNIREESVNEDLRKWFKQKWVRFDTKGNIKGDCAREPGEGKPKCRPLASAVAMGKEARAKAARRKRREDPVANRKGKGGKPVFVKTEAATWAQQAAIAIAKKKSGKYDKEGNRIKEEILNEKNVPTNPRLWSRAKALARQKFDVYPSAYANGWASKWYKSKGGGWKTSSVDEDFKNFVAENTPADREWGTESLTNIYKEATPGQSTMKKKIILKKKVKEDSPPPYGYEFGNNGVGPTFGVVRSPGGLGLGYSLPMNESVKNWMMKEETQEKFIQKYGDDAEKKLIEAAERLDKAGFGTKAIPKSINQIRESVKEPAEMGMIPNQGKEDRISEKTTLAQYKKKIHPQSDFEQKTFKEETPAWQRKEGKSEAGGLNRKGIASYRRENPGSKLSMAVTTKPSKLKKGSKAAKRRKSFCARMGGMKKRLTSAKTARDPDSRINKALRKWNCEE